MKTVMIMLVIAVVFMVLGLIIKSLFGKKKQEKHAPVAPVDVWPYYAKKVMSDSEQLAYQRLRKVLPENDIFIQVGLSRILGVKKVEDKQNWYNKISQMSVDFVVCNRDSSVVAVIELDDPSHKRKNRTEADEKKNKALESAGVKLLRWDTLPEEEKIRLMFMKSQK